MFICTAKLISDSLLLVLCPLVNLLLTRNAHKVEDAKTRLDAETMLKIQNVL